MGRGRRAQGTGQRAEGSGQRAEGRGHKAVDETADPCLCADINEVTQAAGESLLVLATGRARTSLTIHLSCRNRQKEELDRWNEMVRLAALPEQSRCRFELMD